LTVQILSRALAELEACVEYIRNDNPRAAADFASEVFATIEMLAAGDFEGPESVLRSGQRIRSWPVPPLRIYYQRHGDELRILRIYHQARRPITR
jgi:plasmid stabilization system protein ParE